MQKRMFSCIFYLISAAKPRIPSGPVCHGKISSIYLRCYQRPRYFSMAIQHPVKFLAAIQATPVSVEAAAAAPGAPKTEAFFVKSVLKNFGPVQGRSFCIDLQQYGATDYRNQSLLSCAHPFMHDCDCVYIYTCCMWLEQANGNLVLVLSGPVSVAGIQKKEGQNRGGQAWLQGGMLSPTAKPRISSNQSVTPEYLLFEVFWVAKHIQTETHFNRPVNIQAPDLLKTEAFSCFGEVSFSKKMRRSGSSWLVRIV